MKEKLDTIFESGINENLLFPKCKNLSLGQALMAEINLCRFIDWVKTMDWDGEPTISLTKIEILKAYK